MSITFDLSAALLGLCGGLLGGVAYFAALWRAVRRLPYARHPLRDLLLGALLRLSLLLPALYFGTQGGLSVMAGAVVGFLAARTAAIHWLPRPVPATTKG